MKFFKTILMFSIVFMLSVICFSKMKVYIFANSSEENNEKEVLDMSTYELIDKIVDEEINYIYLFSTTNIGISKFKANNDYYIELTNRNEVNSIIEKMINEELLRNNDKLLMLYNIINNYENEENDIFVESNNNVIYTPNGTIIEEARYSVNTLNSNYITWAHNNVLNSYPTITNNNYISPASSAYNCHSYAWYQQDVTNNNYNISFPTAYLEDESYEEVYDVRSGDIICYWCYGDNDMNGSDEPSYYISHSAIVRSVNSLFDLNDNSTLEYINLISKWGSWGLYSHNGDECPYGTEDSQFRYVKAYRPSINEEISLSNPLINATQTIYKYYSVTQYNNITINYALYDLNIDSKKNYDFEISANNPLDVRLYDVHMQLVAIASSSILNNSIYKVSFSNELLVKHYYLRVSFSGDNNGLITTKITNCHNHNYECTWENYIRHRITCTVCSETYLERHITDGTSISSGSPYSYCTICDGLALLTINSPCLTIEFEIENDYIVNNYDIPLSLLKKEE